MFPHTVGTIDKFPITTDIQAIVFKACGSYLFAFQTSCKAEYRSGIGNERDGFNCGGEQGNL